MGGNGKGLVIKDLDPQLCTSRPLLVTKHKSQESSREKELEKQKLSL